MKGKKEGLQGERWCLMETFKKRDDLLKVEKFTSPRKLERGGAGEDVVVPEKETIIVVHPPTQGIPPSPPASSPADGCCPFPRGPQSASADRFPAPPAHKAAFLSA